MAAVSSTLGLQGVTQAAYQQLKLQQARQNADRAEQQARSLERQAADAQREADRAQENARDLSVRSGRAQSEAGRAKQGLAMIRSADEMKSALAVTATRAEASMNGSAARSNPPAAASPVFNTSGQLTGTRVNTQA